MKNTFENTIKYQLCPPGLFLWSSPHINLYHGLYIPLYVLHSVSDHTTENMVQAGWGPFRETFQQYIFRATLSSTVTDNLIQSKSILTTSYPTEWRTEFATTTSVSFSQQNILTVTTSSSIPDTIHQFSHNYLTDDGFEAAKVNFLEILTTEAWTYIVVLALLAIFLFLAGGCRIITILIHGCSTSPTQSRRENVRRRVNSPPTSSILPLISIQDHDSWESPFDTLPPFQFSSQPPLPPRLATNSGLTTSSWYDHLQLEPRINYQAQSVRFVQAVDIIPLPRTPSPTRLGELEYRFPSEEDFSFPPSPVNMAARTSGVDPEYWPME